MSSNVVAHPIAGAPFGAEVELGTKVADLDPEDEAALRAALAAHQVLVLRGDLDDDEHSKLISSFGRLLQQGPRVVVNGRPDGPFPTITYVSNVKAGGGLGTFELSFHSDLAHVPTPLAGLSLYAQDVDPGQAGTLFASGRRAYQLLSEADRAELDGLQCLFTANYTTTTTDVEMGRDGLRHLDPTWPRVVHPVVIPHPVTGEGCVFANEMMTAMVIGMEPEAGDRLLDRLFAVLYDPANVYEHRWSNGDLVIWDNLSIQHARRPVAEERPRTLRRIVFGERTPWEQWPWGVEEPALAAR